MLYDAALLSGAPLRQCAAGRLTFFALAARTRRVAAENPCGLLRWLIENPHCHGWASNADEDRARGWLRGLSPEPSRAEAREIMTAVAPPAPESGLDDDALVFKVAGVPVVETANVGPREAFEVVTANPGIRELLAGWTLQRWEAAARQHYAGRSRHA